MFHKNSAIISRQEEAGKHLVFNPTNCIPLVMNDTSYAIWELCDGTRDSQAIAKELQSKYAFGTEVLGEDELQQIVTRHLTILGHAQLISDAEPDNKNVHVGGIITEVSSVRAGRSETV